MLIETPYKEGDVVSFKLTSGEEIIGRLEKENDTGYSVKKPMVLIMQQQGMGLAPFMFSVSPDGKFFLTYQSVSCIAKTTKEIADQYVSTTSGIAIPAHGVA